MTHPLGRTLAGAILALVLALLGQATALAQNCRFTLGFATLASLIPNQVGSCVENEAYDASGDAVQHTTKGLLVWRKVDNWTAFTNGYETWIDGPSGLVSRLNSERFPWEADASAGPVPPQETIGRSVEGRPLVALGLGQGPKVWPRRQIHALGQPASTGRCCDGRHPGRNSGHELRT